MFWTESSSCILTYWNFSVLRLISSVSGIHTTWLLRYQQTSSVEVSISKGWTSSSTMICLMRATRLVWRCVKWFSFIHSFIPSFLHSFTHSFILSFLHSIHSFIHSFIPSFLHSFILSFIHSFHSFFHSFIPFIPFYAIPFRAIHFSEWDPQFPATLGFTCFFWSRVQRCLESRGSYSSVLIWSLEGRSVVVKWWLSVVLRCANCWW